MKLTRHFNLLAAVAMVATGFAQTPYRDPQGRFSLRVPAGWTASPLGDAVQVKHGNALASVMVSDGAQDPNRLLQSLGGQIGGQWKDFKQLQTAATTVGGQQGAYGVFAGLNPQGVDSLLKIVTVTNGRHSFALIMSSPTGEFMANRPGFDALELGFAPGAAAAAPATQASTGALPDRAVPAGFTLTRDPQGTGRVLFGTFNGNARSATVTAQGMLANLRGYFDNVPEIHTAARNDSDRQVQAFFSASMQNVPVTGVIGVELANGSGTVAIVYDRAGSLRNSYSRLLGPSGAAPRPLRQTTLADGSTIGLPEGWRIAGTGKGSVDVAGANGEMVSLGIWAPVYTQAPSLPGMPANYVLSGPCCDPVRAMAALTPQFSAMLQKSGQPALQLVRVIDAKATPAPGNGGQAAFIFADISVGGRPSQSFSWVAAVPTGSGQWMYYVSTVSAPTDVFANVAPTMLAIWKSYSTNPAVFAERIDNAIKSMNQATASVLAAGREASRVRSAVNERWDQVIRGVDTIENTRTGRRYDVDNRAAQNLVDGLNGSGNGNWKVVPLDELVRR